MFLHFTDTVLVTQAADPVHHLGLVPDPAPGHFPHPAGDGIHIQAHALVPGAAAARDPDPALLIHMDTTIGRVIEGENVPSFSVTLVALRYYYSFFYQHFKLVFSFSRFVVLIFFLLMF